MEAFEYKGVWWLPEAPDYQVNGTLKFDPVEGAELETIGSRILSTAATNAFSSPSPVSEWKVHFGPTQLPIICGHAGGNEVTLYGCVTGGPGGARGYNSERYIIETVFWGHIFEREEELIFDNLFVRYTHLEEWIGKAGFNASGNFAQDSEELVGFEFRYSQPEKISINLQGCSVTLYHFLNWSTDSFKDFDFHQVAVVDFKPKSPLPFSFYGREFIYKFHLFLTLGLDHPIRIFTLKGKSPNAIRTKPDGQNAQKDITIFFASQGVDIPTRKFFRPDALFTFADLEDNFEVYLSNWYRKFEVLQPVYELFFGLMYSPAMPPNFGFLAFAQALEAYYRLLYGGAYLPKKEYKAIRDVLIAAFPSNLDDDFRKSLTDRLRYGYEYELRKRLGLILNETLKEYAETVNNIVEVQDDFISKIVVTRNYWTHFTEELKSKAATTDKELSILTRKLKLILQLCFLVELGLPSVTINKIINNNRQFQWWRS